MWPARVWGWKVKLFLLHAAETFIIFILYCHVNCELNNWILYALMLSRSYGTENTNRGILIKIVRSHSKVNYLQTIAFDKCMGTVMAAISEQRNFKYYMQCIHAVLSCVYQSLVSLWVGGSNKFKPNPLLICTPPWPPTLTGGPNHA